MGIFRDVQIVTQLTVFLIVFLMAADTYLFRVGLLGLLLSRLKPFLFCCPVYLIFTIVQGNVVHKPVADLHPSLTASSHAQVLCESTI